MKLPSLTLPTKAVGIVRSGYTRLGAVVLMVGFAAWMAKEPGFEPALLFISTFGVWTLSEYERSSAPHPHDVRLIERFRRLVPNGSRMWLLQTKFGIPFSQDELSPFIDMAENWNGISYEFEDATLRPLLEEVLQVNAAFVNETTFAYLQANGVALDYRNDQEQRGRTVHAQTRARIERTEENAGKLYEAVEALDREARKCLPI